MMRRKSTPIQRTFHPDHQEVECHERDFPKYEEMTEASADQDSGRGLLKENHQVPLKPEGGPKKGEWTVPENPQIVQKRDQEAM